MNWIEWNPYLCIYDWLVNSLCTQPVIWQDAQTFPLSEGSPFCSFWQDHGMHIQHHRHWLWYNLERSTYLRDQLHGVRSHKGLAINELEVTYRQRNVKTYLLLISVFLDMLLIRLIWDPIGPTITQRRVILNTTCLILQMEICVNHQIQWI